MIAELKFENTESLTKALATPKFQKVQGDVKNLLRFLNKPTVIAITDKFNNVR